MGALFATFLLAAFAAILLSAGFEDVRTREIANWKSIVLALLAPAWWVATGLHVWPDMAVQLGVGVGVFVLFAVLFYLNMMGGGDVKLIAALALWMPPTALLWTLVVMSIAGGALTLAMLLEKYLRRQQHTPEIPYGVAIAIAGLLAIREPIFNPFM